MAIIQQSKVDIFITFIYSVKSKNINLSTNRIGGSDLQNYTECFLVLCGILATQLWQSQRSRVRFHCKGVVTKFAYRLVTVKSKLWHKSETMRKSSSAFTVCDESSRQGSRAKLSTPTFCLRGCGGRNKEILLF